LPTLWRIAHDETEIPAGVFLKELAELDLDWFGNGLEITQQTLSNYVKRGWVERRRVATAPAGRGQTGYFERRMLVAAIFAHDFWMPHGDAMTAPHIGHAASRDTGAFILGLLETAVQEHFTDELQLGVTFASHGSGELVASSQHHEIQAAYLVRATRIGLLSRLLEAVPTDQDEFAAFAPDARGRQAINQLRKLLGRALTSPVSLKGESGNQIPDLIHTWLASTPGNGSEDPAT
jgi:hypothetical protein